MNALFMQGYETFNTNNEAQFIDINYEKAENISIDYAVMEKAANGYVLPATFDWNDLGTWGQLLDKIDKDDNNNGIINAKVILENASNNIIRSDADKIIVIDGFHDYIIVDKLQIYQCGIITEIYSATPKTSPCIKSVKNCLRTGKGYPFFLQATPKKVKA